MIKETIDEQIIKQLPKDIRKKGQTMMDYRKRYPETLTWNDREEFVNRGVVMSGPKMSDLLSPETLNMQIC